MTYPLARDGIFWTLQGEGALSGVPMRFIRLAGCSVGCEQCDTDYKVNRRLSIDEIAAEYDALPYTKWAFVTGGEPFDHDLTPLLAMLRKRGSVAAVTSGHVAAKFQTDAIDFLTVSPHSTPDKLMIRMAAQVNLVPELGGMDLKNWETFDFKGFGEKWVTPLSGRWNIDQCVKWVKSHAGWRMGMQAHKSWGVA